MKRSRALQVLVFLLFACICGTPWSEAADLKGQILGKWVEVGGTQMIEFLQDGTVIIVEGRMSAAGDYRFIDNRRLRMDLKGLYGSKVVEVSKNAKTGELSLREPNGTVSTYITEAESARRITAARKAAAEAERKRIEIERRRVEAEQMAESILGERLLALEKILKSEDDLGKKIDKINHLLAKGLDLNASPPQYMGSAFEYAAEAKDVRLMEFLISKGMQVNDRNKYRCNAMVVMNDVMSPAGREMVEMLLAKGLDVGCARQFRPFVFGISQVYRAPGIVNDNWKVDEAINALEMMRKWRIDLNATDSGKTLLAYLNDSPEEIRTKAAPVIEYLQADSDSARKVIADAVRETAAAEKKAYEDRLRDFSDVIAVATGVALRKDGTVWVWGDKQAAVHVKGLSDVIAVTKGERHNIAIKKDGSVWAFGHNGSGQLGDGTATDSVTSVQVSGLSDFLSVAVGREQTVALKKDGTVWVWKTNVGGQIDNDSITGGEIPVQMKGLSDVIAVTAGAQHSVALKRDGTVWAWGANGSGQLGDGTTANRTAPTKVKGLSGVIAVTTRHWQSQTVAIKSDGTVWAWGFCEVGLGDGKQLSSSIPVKMKSFSDVVAVAAGGLHTVALKKDGTVWGWWGNIGGVPAVNGDESQTPKKVKGLSDMVAVSEGVALKRDGTVWAWRYNDYGLSSSPVMVKRLADDAIAP